MTNAFAIFAAVDTLVLERVAGRVFRCLGEPPTWCRQLWPDCVSEAKDLAPEAPFPFLEVFLAEAEGAWSAHPPARVDSETWTLVDKTGQEIHLRAIALRVEDGELLLLERCDALHRAQQLLLSRARELRIAHDAAGRISEQKDVLVHCIIHDLQAPLAAILDALAQLQRRSAAPEIMRLSAVALRAAEQQRELILDILQVFAFDDVAGSERAPRQHPSADLIAVVNRAVLPFSAIARARGQELSWDPRALGGNPVFVVGDARRLERVVSNLVENALANAVTRVKVSAAIEEDRICVAVDDDGGQLSPDLHSSLFAKLGERRGDLDLGLYFCRITVERSGGSIGYEPLVGAGGGRRLWVRLPRALTSATASTARAAAVGA